jgi:hypothetical protein
LQLLPGFLAIGDVWLQSAYKKAEPIAFADQDFEPVGAESAEKKQEALFIICIGLQIG